jgi:hypothetical protein
MAHRVISARLVTLDHRGPLEIQAPLVQQVMKGQQELQAQLGLKAHKARQAIQAPKVHKVTLGQQDPQVLKVLQV